MTKKKDIRETSPQHEHIAYYYTHLSIRYRGMAWNEKARWALHVASNYRAGIEFAP